MSDSRHESAHDLTTLIESFDLRLSQLERTTARLNQRLLSIEKHMRSNAAPETPLSPAPPAPRPDLTPEFDHAAVQAATSVLPAGEAKRDLGSLIDTLLDGSPVTRAAQSLPAPATRTAQSPRPRHSPPALPRPRRPLELRELEQVISGRGLAWVGGLALLLGALFFLSLAINRGWIGPEERVVIGLMAGLAITVCGERLLRRQDRILAPVLIAVGIGIWNLALVAGTRLYDVIPLPWALLGAAAGAVVATAYALRTNAQITALYGLVTAMAAPMLFDVPDAKAPIHYLGIILAGSTAISIARGWWWLPPASFALSQLQFYAWWLRADAPPAMVVPAIVALTFVHMIAATGVEVKSTSFRAHTIAVALLMLNAISFTIVGIGELHESRIALGLYLLLGMAAHVGVGVTVQRRKVCEAGLSHLAFAIAVILLTIAIAAFCSGPMLAIGWGVEALFLVWLANRSRRAAAFWGAAIVYGLAISHLFLVELQMLEPVSSRISSETPFVNAAGLTLLALLALLVAAGAILRERWAQGTLATIGLGLLMAAMPFQLSGLALLAGWALLAVGALAIDRLLAVRPESVPLDPVRAQGVATSLVSAATLAAALAIGRAICFEMPLRIAALPSSAAGYVGQPVAAAAIVIVAALAGMAVTRSGAVRQMAGSIALLIAGHLAAYALAPALAVAAWSVLAVVAWHLQQRETGPTRAYLAAAALLLICGLAVSLVEIAPPARLLLTANAPSDQLFLWRDATLALGSLALAYFAIGWQTTRTSARGWLALAGGVLTIYLLSIGIVAGFQGRVTDASSVAELQRQAQVALSIVWALLGGVMVAAGLARGLPFLRWFGLGLLALATVKVFLFDLSSLDAAYRVMSFLVLGLLLLLSSYAYQRFGSPPEEREHDARQEALPGEAGEAR